MSKTVFYRQCRLCRANTTTTSWIPEKHATIGNPVSLKHGDHWSHGWIVVAVYSRLEAKDVENQAHNASDIWKATSGPCPRGNK